MASGIKTGTLAGVLLPHATAEGVVDILLPRSDLSSEVRLKAAPSQKVAKKYVKGKAAKAATVASQPDTDPAILAQLAKNPLVSVRRALLKNPSTPYDSVLTLTHWAHTREDLEDKAAGIVRLTPDDMYTVMLARKREHDYTLAGAYPFRKIAEAMVETGDKALVLKAYALNIAGLQEELLRSVYERPSPCISLTELATSSPEESSARLARLTASQEHCTLELAKLLGKIPSDWKTHYYQSLSPFIFLADGAAVELLASENTSVRRLAMQSGARGSVLDETISRSDLAMVTAMVRDVGSEFTRPQEKALLKQVLRFAQDPEQQYAASTALVEVLKASRHRLPSKLLIEAFQLAGSLSVGIWLSGGFSANYPRPGEVERLVKDPGMAFVRSGRPHGYGGYSYHNSAYGYGNAQQTPVNTLSTPEDVRAVLVSNMDAAMRHPWANEYAVALGESLLPNLPRSRHSADWVARRFYAAFGTHEGCWETMLSLSADWSEDIESLITTTLLVNEVEPPTLVEPTRPEQLQLDGM